MTKDEIIKKTIKDHFPYEDYPIVSESTEFYNYISMLPCIECIVQPMCIQRIKIFCEKHNDKDPTFENEDNYHGDVFEFIEIAIESKLEDTCVLMEEYMRSMRIVDTGYRSDYVLQTIAGYFGERVGIWYCKQKNKIKERNML